MNRFLPLALAAIALLGACDKVVEKSETSVLGYDMQFLLQDTKTLNDGLYTRWAANDEISVFHAAASSGAYVSDGCFTVCDADSGLAGGSLSSALDDGADYDWAALYPYDASNRDLSSLAVTIGSAAGKSQLQTGSGSLAHAAGAAMPLYGKALQQSSAKNPIVTLSNLASLVEVEVTNALAGDIVVTEVKLCADEPLTGSFLLDLTSSDPVVSDGSKVSNEAVLSVSGAEPIPSGEAGRFYVAVKPFTGKPGQRLLISVSATCDEGVAVQEKEVALSSDIVFASGKIKKAKVDFSAKPVFEKTAEFDPSHVVLSFGVVSDVHVENTTAAPATKFKSALGQLQARAKVNDPDGIDAVLVAGDLVNGPYTNSSAYSQVNSFKLLYETVFNPEEVPMIYTVGNHDVYGQWNSSTVSEAVNISSRLGTKYFKYDVDMPAKEKMECRHCIVGGCHILCITPNSHGSPSAGYDPAALSWLDGQLKAITDADPESYVMVLTHPMIYNTVYGSDLNYGSLAWYTSSLSSILKKYPQVIDFGGHLHFPLNDPRSIWQGDFTVCGTASVRYMAIENGGYQDMASATTMLDKDEYSEGYLMQMDRSGNVRLTRMDFYRSAEIGEPWDLSHPVADRSHLKRYSHDERSFRNGAPVMDYVKVNKTAVGRLTSYVMEFGAARDDEFAHHYVVTLSKGGSVQSTRKFLADFYRNPQPSGMKQVWTRDLGNLAEGSYAVSAVAYDSWGAVSNTVSSTFTVEKAEAGETSLYVDVDFRNGQVLDAEGHASLENVGVTVAPVEVSHKGVRYTVETATFTGSNYIAGKFKDISTFSQMQQFGNMGFTAEAFYVDKVPNTTGVNAHGILCATEQGGWGLAVRSTGVPYFIVGDGSVNSYKNADAASAASKTELTHVVGVYDYAGKKIHIYVNGVLSRSAAISGPFYPGSGDTFNRFILGGDTRNGSVMGDFPPSDMQIVDARFYSGALDADAVAKAYEEAVNSLKK